MKRCLSGWLLLVLAAAAQSPPPETARALQAISANSLRGNLSFIASPLLEGRDTPSRGLEIAATFIASQFRAAGLEPAGDDGYFQNARLLSIASPGAGFEMRLESAGHPVTVAAAGITAISQRPLEITNAPIYKIADKTDLRTEAIKGRVVLAARREIAQAAAAMQPAALLEIAEGPGVPRLIDPDEAGIPSLTVRDPDAVRLLEEARIGETGITVSIKLPAATATPVTLHNVAGWLRGSDALLREEYVLLTAHYDHIGRNSAGEVYPGANDDGSGTVSVIEIARVLAAMPVHPKRSIVFMTFFGEEEGGLGSRYYTRHPLFPMAKTVADLNLEQLGRTDSNAGREISNASLTGFRYSTVAQTLQEAGRLTGVKVYETPNDDDYFKRSDNLTFAEHGIPAHTLVVAFEFPDYHGVGDIWEKIDYGNMAKVDRMIALGVVLLADATRRPQWNGERPKL